VIAVIFAKDASVHRPPRHLGLAPPRIPASRYTTRNARESEVATVTDSAPKSAYELAMERLRQKDKEGGVVERPLTDEQKAAIAEARRVYDAKVAEREILHRDALRQAKSHEEVQKLNEELARDRDRFARDRDRKIGEIRERRA
jgi:hypothetical protein